MVMIKDQEKTTWLAATERCGASGIFSIGLQGTMFGQRRFGQTQMPIRRAISNQLTVPDVLPDDMSATELDESTIAPNVVLSVIVPAYNEHECLPSTLEALRKAAAIFENQECGKVEMIVVNDGSTDDTRAIASRLADEVVDGTRRGIGLARNTGAAVAKGSLFIFVDADTVVDEEVLVAIYESWESNALAGAVAALYESHHWPIRILFAVWRWYARHRCMTQGVCQFFDRTFFNELGGYRQDLLMAEDTDLYQRARQALQKRGQTSRCQVIDSVKVHPSMRRYEQWASWRVIFWTNPCTTICARRSRWFWRHWYDDPPR